MNVSFLLTFILFLFLSESYSETTRQSNSSKKVIITKCCRIGDLLNKSGICEPGLGTAESWAPRVFLPKKKLFYEKQGSLPAFFNLKEEVKPNCHVPEFFKSSEVNILGNGSLYIHARHLTIESYENFCVDQDYSIICRNGQEAAPDNLTLVKLTKCCAPNQIYAASSCIGSTNKSDLLFIPSEDGARIKFDLEYKFPECVDSNEFAIQVFSSNNFDISTGNVRTESGKVFTREQYCLDHVIGNNYYEGVKLFTCSEHYGTVPPSVNGPQDKLRFIIYSSGLFISVLFLIATLAVGFLLLSNHHMLHWRCQTNYVICLLIGDLLLAITQCLSPESLRGPACVIIAHLMHFFFLATFFWLNTMCFNIWWTFRDFRPTSMEKSQESLRLRVYEVYAWGMPIIITTVAAVLDNLPESPSDGFLRPRFGENKCWFNGKMEIFVYFFGPIGMLLCINILLFLSTARQLTCGLWKQQDVKSTTERAALGRVCMKLVIVMGVTWIIDVISWAVDGEHIIWYFTDIINALQGLFIFLVVGFQPQVWSALKRFWSSRSGDHRMTGTTNGPQHSISSHGMPSLDASVTNQTTSSKVETMC